MVNLQSIIGTQTISGGQLESLMAYLALLGLLLFIAIELRQRISIFRSLFIPSVTHSWSAGACFGSVWLKVFPQEMMTSISSLPGRLISVVFAPMLIGVAFINPRKVKDIVLPQILYSYLGSCLLIGVPLLFVALVLIPFGDANPLFGTIIEVGWAGGHGTAGGLADEYVKYGWEPGGDLGLTSATVGLFYGIIAGMFLINYGVRKGYTAHLHVHSELNTGSNDGDILPKEKQVSGSKVTFNKDVVETFAFHAALIGIAILIGKVIVLLIKWSTGFSMPLFPMAMMGGFILNLILERTKYKEAIDKETLNRIQTLAIEILIIAAIASIKVPVVLEYAAPFLLLMVLGMGVMYFYFMYFGPKFFKETWFENAIVNFGAMAGVTAVGLMLLRTVDPEMKTDVFKAFALRAPFFSPFAGGGLITTMMIVVTYKYGALIIGSIFLASAVAIVVFARFSGIWNNMPKKR